MSPSPRADAGPTAVSFNAGDGQGAARGVPRAAPSSLTLSPCAWQEPRPARRTRQRPRWPQRRRRQPAVELVACPSVATFLERLHCLLVEGRGNEDCAGLCAARAQLDGFNLSGGDVVGLVLTKIGKCSGRHVLIGQVVVLLRVF